MSQIKKPENKTSPSLLRQRLAAGTQTNTLNDYVATFGGMMPLMEAYADDKLPEEDRRFLEAQMSSSSMANWLQSVYAKKSCDAVLHICGTLEKLANDYRSAYIEAAPGRLGYKERIG